MSDYIDCVGVGVFAIITINTNEMSFLPIINADDFGKSESVNEAIIDCFRHGYITNTTIMVNMPCAGRARELAIENGFADCVGLHINLTEGMPLTEGIRKRKLFCDSEGMFTAEFHRNTNSRLFLGAKDSVVVRAEMEAQIQRYLDMGFTEMHLDSHHHVHTNPAIARILIPLARKYGFRSMRLSRNMDIFSLAVSKKIYKSLLNREINRRIGGCSDRFGSFDDYERDPARSGSIELMCHPEYVREGESRILTNMGAETTDTRDFAVFRRKHPELYRNRME